MPRALIVEDDASIAGLCARMLKTRGLDARVAGTMGEALTALDTGGPFEFAYVDVALPDGDGVGLADEIRRRNPAMPVLLVTGYARDLDATYPVLRKPFEVADFRRAVDTCLRAQRGGGGASAP